MCSVRSVDRGLLLHRLHEKLYLPKYLSSMINDLFLVNKRGFPYKIEDFERYPCLEKEPHLKSRTKRRILAPWYQSEADVYSLFKVSNLKIFTNTKIRKPVSCTRPNTQLRHSIAKHAEVDSMEDDEKPDESSRQQDSKKPQLRKFFPETWLYDLVSVGPRGKTQLNLTTPDSITEWVTDAFCLGSSGFGEAEEVGLTTFKPYFIDLILPYSVVQGEEFPLTALVFSYVKHCMLVAVSLSETSDFTFEHGLRDQTSCICEAETVRFTWNITTTKPGTIRIMVSSGARELKEGCTHNEATLGTTHREDSLEKAIVVKHRGEPESKTQTWLLCPDAATVRQNIMLDIPENMLEDSEHAHITVLGDIMGNAISNVGYLLKMPYGCGEQNMGIFAPNIFILQYLKNSNQLTTKIQDETGRYLTTGYQRQLMFKHNNGSYSAFGSNDKEGNTWLTAFVVKSFIQAQEFIFIDEKHILEAVRWLSSLQLPNGCFQSVGKLFNNQLKSGVDDEVSLTAYIAVSLLEHRTVHSGNVVENALRCLKDASDKVNSTYTLALMAYAFTLYGDDAQRQHVFEILEKSVIRTDGSKHWALDSFDTGGIEMSAYVILALLSWEKTSHKDIAQASEIISWVIKQQNYFGGFSSTQDTVVALQALALYAKDTYRQSGDVKVTIRSLSNFQHQFDIDKSNRFLQQRVTLPDIPGEYSVTAMGSGCVYVQAHLKYHIPPPKSDTYFALTVSTDPSVCTKEAQESFNILIKTSYTGNRISSNMALIEVDLLSGYFPIKQSVKRIEKSPNVKRTEVTPEKVSIYLEELTDETESFFFSLKQETRVQNLQPATVRVYDYYAPGERALAEYNAPCSSGAEEAGSK